METIANYDGCHPDITQSLCHGIHILCTCGSRMLKDDRVIVAFVRGRYMSIDGFFFDDASPSPKTETYVIDAVSMMKGLIERGFEPDNNGNWCHKCGSKFWTQLWVYCGKKHTDNTITWIDWMIERREAR